MSPSAVLLLFAAATAAVITVLYAGRKAKHRREARELAARMVPEIRAILEDSEVRAGDTAVYTTSRGRLPLILSKETLFAVETFYQSADALARASEAMKAAFAQRGETSLGDRIRAKDQRDRSLKDVYYAGEAAIQKLESSSR